MAFTIKNRTLPGSPFLVEYDCTSCGRFELIVARDEHGDPPDIATCECGETAELAISSPKIAFWTRAIVPINPAGSTRHDEPDPRALDTSELASGKLTKAQWQKKQLEITKARRHAKRIKSGQVSKRIQSSGTGKAM